MDDIERACQDIPYWTKPGDYTKQKWLEVKDTKNEMFQQSQKCRHEQIGKGW